MGRLKKGAEVGMMPAGVRGQVWEHPTSVMRTGLLFTQGHRVHPSGLGGPESANPGRERLEWNERGQLDYRCEGGHTILKVLNEDLSKNLVHMVFSWVTIKPSKRISGTA